MRWAAAVALLMETSSCLDVAGRLVLYVSVWVASAMPAVRKSQPPEYIKCNTQTRAIAVWSAPYLQDPIRNLCVSPHPAPLLEQGCTCSSSSLSSTITGSVRAGCIPDQQVFVIWPTTAVNGCLRLAGFQGRYLHQREQLERSTVQT